MAYITIHAKKDSTIKVNAKFWEKGTRSLMEPYAMVCLGACGDEVTLFINDLESLRGLRRELEEQMFRAALAWTAELNSNGKAELESLVKVE